jgi:hypothetical protein
MPPVRGRRTGPQSLPTGNAFAHREVAAARARSPTFPSPSGPSSPSRSPGAADEIAAELGVSWLTINRQLVWARAAARATTRVMRRRPASYIARDTWRSSLRTARKSSPSHLTVAIPRLVPGARSSRKGRSQRPPARPPDGTRITPPSRPTRKRSERSARRPLEHESDSGGALAGRHQSGDLQPPSRPHGRRRSRTEFVPKPVAPK